jgi:hypothetical protein
MLRSTQLRRNVLKLGSLASTTLIVLAGLGLIGWISGIVIAKPEVRP